MVNKINATEPDDRLIFAAYMILRCAGCGRDDEWTLGYGMDGLLQFRPPLPHPPYAEPWAAMVEQTRRLSDTAFNRDETDESLLYADSDGIDLDPEDLDPLPPIPDLH